ncbi:unnamed protein product [Vicia faba]|uniref:Uncharacterized protein n=1 Tax=Vicia faba TaxID=3906 RepID=A0AAV0YH68_VICFA|nr:unnamed protein product [Vicia faba]
MLDLQQNQHNKFLASKERSGPLKTGVDTVKEAVKTVINKFHQVPVKLLKYVDRKKVSTQARSVVTEVRRAGVVESASGLAKTVYSKYEPKAEAPPLFRLRRREMRTLLMKTREIIGRMSASGGRRRR